MPPASVPGSGSSSKDCGLPRSGDSLGECALIHRLERQRLRLAFDLHDGPAQTIAAALLQLEVVDQMTRTESLRAELTSLRKMLRGALADVREMAHELRPSSLDKNELVPRLRDYSERLREDWGMRVDLAVRGPSSPLSSSAQIAVFRVVQEALSNARRHGGADNADVEVMFSDNEVVCTIRDDGCGLAASESHENDSEAGRGLKGMEERIGLLDGTIDVSSASDGGTTVTARIPAWGDGRSD